MNRVRWSALLTAAALGLSSGWAVAQADDHKDNGGPGQHGGASHGNQGPQDKGGKGGPQGGPASKVGPSHAAPQAHGGPAPMAHAAPHHDGPGAGPDHSFYKGDRLPTDFRHKRYYVDDWRAHHLPRPPRGQRWIQVGGDYVLVSIASGLIFQIVIAP
jgi:Ni/Co efflux regulator RcnB